MAELTIQEILDEEEAGLDLEILSGAEGLTNVVTVPRIQKPGLALAGYSSSLHPDRIQVLGSTELSFLSSMSKEQAIDQLRAILSRNLSCLIVTKDLDVPDYLVEQTETYKTPLLRTRALSSTFISLITKFLEERLLPTSTLHGVLIDILGVGVLLQGKSGIGKSECALDLILRGHRLVADDVIKVRLKLPSVIFGEGMDLLHYHMEIRGLGILNIKHLFGVAAIRERKKIDMAIELVPWEDGREYDRLGLEEQTFNIHGVELPFMRIPVGPGRNAGTIVEVAARNQLLKEMGYHSAREFQDLLEKRMAEAARLHAHTIIGDNLE
ncbi:Hpr(Ser) kinase/phosphatase [Malonomonas rubra DSM 5091]|uniref:HPr kinase/phosphorylase n=1 Tax=Malonomonas rubra DSM 5091 TaxID=1122189 RepID=A0A1M6DXS4_MALRU|nr:HPr(Ser) kinase/phosphatase [Malonomonas rubra]SHI78002.1 Hpr(Ser) kinase/phosphatase [Malonomonas rubra DSM 5091]